MVVEEGPGIRGIWEVGGEGIADLFSREAA